MEIEREGERKYNIIISVWAAYRMMIVWVFAQFLFVVAIIIIYPTLFYYYDF